MVEWWPSALGSAHPLLYPGILLGAIFITSGAALTFHASSLLACMTPGFVMVNTMEQPEPWFEVIERVEEVLERMVAGHVEEIPVLDEQGAVVADLTMIDLLMEERKKLEVGN